VSISEGPVHVNEAPHPAASAGRILDVLRSRTGSPDLAYAVPPVILGGGFWAELFSVRFANPPPELEGDLVVRVMPDALFARKETIIQAGVAAQGYPAPAVRFVADADNPLGRAFMVMERAPGSPMLGGLSVGAILAQLPWLLRHLPMLLADATVRLHALDPEPIRAQLAAATAPMAPSTTAAFLSALSTYADDLGRPDLARTGRRLAELHPPPGEEVVCHGDLHPFNMLVDSDRFTIIDWTTALIAEPAYDLAFTRLMLVNVPIHVPAVLRVPLHLATRLVAGTFLRQYRRRARIPVSAESLRWYTGLHCLRALIEVAGWTRTGEIDAHVGHPWLTVGAHFAALLHRLTGIAVAQPH
jgi:aminoglycoside phosphotransferase (APT) family kinase protein